MSQPKSICCCIANVLSRSSDGLTLIMSSSDGFCSTLSFAPGELGQPYLHPVSVSTSSSTNATHTPSLAANPASTTTTPLPTPTHTNTVSPSLPKPNPAPASAGLNNGTAAPSSPARSSSASSIQTLQPSQPGSIVNNPTPTLGTVPLVTATNSLPLTTPPQTPLHSISHSASNSFSSTTVLGKRDINAASESEKEESKADSRDAVETEKPAKKRRIAPTLVSAGSAIWAVAAESVDHSEKKSTLETKPGSTADESST